MSTQAAVVHYALEPLAVELREVPIPQVGDGEVLLEVGAVSVCGSDVHQSRNTHSWPVNIRWSSAMNSAARSRHSAVE